MDVDLKFDYDQALKRNNFNQSHVNALRETVKYHEDIPKSLTDKQLLLFLNKCDGDLDKAVKLMNKHYEIKRKAPQIFTNRDILLPEIKQCLENQYYFNLPPTKDYHIICYHALSNPNPKFYNYIPATNCFLMMIEAANYKYGPSNGLILLYDMKNFRLGHLTRNHFRSLKSFFAYMQEGLVENIEAIHIFNTFPSFNLVMKLIGPLMRADIVKKMHLHSSSLDLERFHAEHVDKSSLPSDYKGVCESVEELHKHHINELLDMREYFIAEEKQTHGNV